MTTYTVQIKPLSPGTHGGRGGLAPGTGQYATTPNGQRDATVPMSDTQITTLQAMLVLILSGADMTTVELAVALLGPT